MQPVYTVYAKHTLQEHDSRRSGLKWAVIQEVSNAETLAYRRGSKTVLRDLKEYFKQYGGLYAIRIHIYIF